MARQRPEKEPEPAPPTRRVLPMELQVGDRFSDEAGEWEVVGRPHTAAGGKIAHARVQRVDHPVTFDVRSWSANERISVRRATTEEGKAVMRLARRTALLVALSLLTSAATARAECA